eukprot:GHVN01098867.1.p1 GENE.GHVN01098867.1~~GHVN01098867.1.p1  ORF type:complete len:162 (-),score=23.82 GHVN01098867.1:33-518(-)
MAYVIDSPNVTMMQTPWLNELQPLREAERFAAESITTMARHKFGIEYPKWGQLDAARIVIIEVVSEGLSVDYIIHQLPLGWIGSAKADKLTKKLTALCNLRRRVAGESGDQTAQSRFYRRVQGAARVQTTRDIVLPKGTKTSVEYVVVANLVRDGSVDIIG